MRAALLHQRHDHFTSARPLLGRREVFQIGHERIGPCCDCGCVRLRVRAGAEQPTAAQGGWTPIEG
jgi:hypothetical protein